ncbi:AT-rich interactive domain-containing protein 1B-like [Arapaima gigas]
MAARVAHAPGATKSKKPGLSGGLSLEPSRGTPLRGGAHVPGAPLGTGDGAIADTMNNVDLQHRPSAAGVARASSAGSSGPRERERESERQGASESTACLSASVSGVASSSMDTGSIASHKRKNVGGADPPPACHRHAPPQQQLQLQQQQPFSQFQQHHARQIQNSNINSPQLAQGDAGVRQHGGKENMVGSRAERSQQPMSKSEEENNQPCKSGERMGGRYEHGSLGPANNNNTTSSSSNFIGNNQPPGAGGSSGAAPDFNHYYGNARGGPVLEQHGGQQSPGIGLMHSSASSSMDQVQNSHEGYNSQYNHYQNYRPGYGGAAYGMMSPSRHGNSMMGPAGSGGAGHGKTAMAAAAGTGSGAGGFQRFPVQSQQHGSGATPTLNELLTSPSPVIRGYGGGYPDYSGGPSAQQQAGMALGKDMGAQFGSPGHGWGGQQRNHPVMNPGNNGQSLARTQMASMDPMAMKRPHLYPMGNTPYTQHQQGGTYHGQPYSSPSPHQYPMGMQSRGQVGMGGMQYPQHQQMPAQYSQQAMGGYCQQGQPPYFNQPPQSTAPTQPMYMQPRAPPQQEIPSDGFGSRSQPPVTTGKPSHEDMGLIQQDRPSSLPVSTPCHFPVAMQCFYRCHISPSSSFSSYAHVPSKGNYLSFCWNLSCNFEVTRIHISLSTKLFIVHLAVGCSDTLFTLSTLSCNCTCTGFVPAMPRNAPPPQCGPQQPGPSVSPHTSPGVPIHQGGGPYQQGGSSGPPYASQGGQYGPQGNYPRVPSYGGAPGVNYNVPGASVGNSLGLNASGPMHGQGPGQPCSSMPMGRAPLAGIGGRPYSGNSSGVAPNSPSMPQPAGPGMGPPPPSISRKLQDTSVSSLQATSSPAPARPPYEKPTAHPSQGGPGAIPLSGHTPQPQHAGFGSAQGPPVMSQPEQYGQSSYPVGNQMGMLGTTASYTGNSSGRMTPQGPPYNTPSLGPLAMTGDGMVAGDSKQKVDNKEEGSVPSLEPSKVKDSYSSQCVSQPPTPSPLSPSPASLSSYHGDDSDSICSPAWPKTPSSPKHNSSTVTAEKITRLYQMGTEPERRSWVDRYLTFMEERGTPVPTLPTVGKKPLDLWRLYMCVKEIGGLAMVNKNKKWRELSTHLKVGTSSSSASSLKKQYIQYLFAFECKVERGEEPPPDAFTTADTKKQLQANIQPPSPANSGSLQGPHTPQSTGSSSMTDMPGDGKPPTPASTPHTQTSSLQSGRNSTVSVQDPFTEANDPVFQKRAALTPGAPYPQGGNMPEAMTRMQYEASKDPFAPGRKGVGGNEPYMPGQMASSGMQEAYSHVPPSGAMTSLGMGQRPQYPFGPGYDRRPDHVMGPEGGLAPHGGQNNDPGLYSPNRYPSQQRHEGYGQPYPHSMPYGVHQAGLFPQQQSYKRPTDGMYGPPAKRHEGEPYSMPYGGQQPDVYVQYGSYSDRRPMQGQFPYAYGRDRMPPSGQIPPQMMGGGPMQPPPCSGSSDGHQPNVWPPRTDMPYPYASRQGQGPSYSMGQADDTENRSNQDGSWQSQASQRQSSFLPSTTSSPSSSSSPMPSMTTRPPPSSFQTPPSITNHTSRDPSPAPFQRSIETHMSPSKAHFIASVKTPKPGVPVPSLPGQAPPPVWREAGYPPGSVEATQPVLKARRKMTSKDTGTPEAWRVMMSLKSGLLAESTWALDTINVLLYDDSTVGSFTLTQLPGFLELIVEYFRRCLIEMFGILKEYEVGTTGQKTLLRPAVTEKKEIRASPLSNDTKVGVDQGEEKQEVEREEALPGFRQGGLPEEEPQPEPLMKEENVEASIQQAADGKDNSEEKFTQVSELRLKQASKFDRFPLKLEEKEWDGSETELSTGEGFTSGLLHWQAGGGDSTAHIQTHFESNGCIEGGECWGVAEREARATTEAVQRSQCEGDSVPFPIPWARSPQQPNDMEDEPRCRDDAPLSIAADWQDSLARRCVCISNIVRGLSFVPGNDTEMSRHPGLVLILGKLVLLHHEHAERKWPTRVRRDEANEEEPGLACIRDEWRWDCLAQLRENTMVTLANIAGQLDLSLYPESICLPVLDGLLHWTVCPSAQARDPFPAAGPYSALTPQRLVLECLCKLSVQDGNVDLLLATPPAARRERLFAALVRHVAERRSQVCREMAVAVLSNLARGDALAARAIAIQRGSVGSLASFLEDGVAMAQYQHGPHGPPHPEPPSVSMMCRAAKALLAMAEVEENRSEFVLHEGRLLDIAMSSVLNSAVASIVCQVLFKISRL